MDLAMGSDLEEAKVHPYINKLIADERAADMRADAAAYRLSREGKASARKSAERQLPRHRVEDHGVPVHVHAVQQARTSSSQPAAPHSTRHDDARLVSAGRAGTDQCK